MSHHHKGAQDIASQFGYELECFEIGENVQDSLLSQVLIFKGVQEAIFGPMPSMRDQLNLDWPRMAIVSIEYTFAGPAIDRVVTDSYGSMRSPWNNAVGRGYTRIGPALASIVEERNEGLLSAAYCLASDKIRRIERIPPLIVKQPPPRPSPPGFPGINRR